MNAREAQTRLATMDSRRLGLIPEQPIKHLLGRLAVAASQAMVSGRSNLMTMQQNARAAGDDVLHLALETRALTRAPVGVTDTTTVAALNEQVADLIAVLTQRSALGRLNAIDAVLNGISSRMIPRLTLGAAGTGWIAEGDPHPIVAAASGAATLGPAKKLGGGAVLSRELFTYSDAAQLIEALLLQDIAKKLDTAAFSNAVATASTPAGLFSVTHASAPIASTSLEADIRALAAAISQNFAMSEASWILNPAKVNSIMGLSGFDSLATNGTLLGARVIATPDIPATRLGILVDQAIVRTITPDTSSVSVSDSATVHMDSAPVGDISTATTQVMSVWQRDSLAVRAITWAAFASLTPAAVQHVEGA
jgi:HK97 family phage major capsid protein